MESKPPDDDGPPVAAPRRPAPPSLMQRLVYRLLGMRAALDRPWRPATEGDCVSLIRFRVFSEKAEVLPRIWAAQRNMLAGQPGFLSAELLSGPGDSEFLIMTRWESAADLDRWKEAAREKGGKHMAAMLRGESKMVEPPYEVSRWEVQVSSG